MESNHPPVDNASDAIEEDVLTAIFPANRPKTNSLTGTVFPDPSLNQFVSPPLVYSLPDTPLAHVTIHAFLIARTLALPS